MKEKRLLDNLNNKSFNFQLQSYPCTCTPEEMKNDPFIH